jgi:hypothetical protein
MIEPSVFNHVKRKARKKHACCECTFNIHKGENYSYISGIWDGKPNSYKQCNDCNDLFFAAMKSQAWADEGPTFKNLKDFFMDFADFDENGNPDIILLASQFDVNFYSLSWLLTKPKVKS